MLDSNLKPYLLEVNQMPSFATETPLDVKVKRGVISDTIKLLQMTKQRRWQTMQWHRSDMRGRLLTQVGTNVDKKQLEESPLKRKEKYALEREDQRRKHSIEREQYEASQVGCGFALLYPHLKYEEEYRILDAFKTKQTANLSLTEIYDYCQLNGGQPKFTETLTKDGY